MDREAARSNALLTLELERRQAKGLRRFALGLIERYLCRAWA